MIRDITIGQYYPVDSPIHRLDARIKLGVTFLFIVTLFLVNSFTGLHGTGDTGVKGAAEIYAQGLEKHNDYYFVHGVYQSLYDKRGTCAVALGIPHAYGGRYPDGD